MNKISKQDFFDLDPMEVDEKYGKFLTEEDSKELEKVFNDESVDDQDYIEKFYDMVYKRIQELGLVS
jgi:hypothetical protein